MTTELLEQQILHFPQGIRDSDDLLPTYRYKPPRVLTGEFRTVGQKELLVPQYVELFGMSWRGIS